jgi:hypothetical protein
LGLLGLVMPSTPMNMGLFFFHISSCWSFGSGWECLHLGFSFCSFPSISLATPHSQNIYPLSNLLAFCFVHHIDLTGAFYGDIVANL